MYNDAQALDEIRSMLAAGFFFENTTQIIVSLQRYAYLREKVIEFQRAYAAAVRAINALKELEKDGEDVEERLKRARRFAAAILDAFERDFAALRCSAFKTL